MTAATIVAEMPNAAMREGWRPLDEQRNKEDAASERLPAYSEWQ